MFVLVLEGFGGVYFFKNFYGVDNVVIFKFCDEELLVFNNFCGFVNIFRVVSREGLKKGMIVGEGVMWEVVVYLLDYFKEGCRFLFRKYLIGFVGVFFIMMVWCVYDVF